jgi:flagellar biosynthesis protein FlhG
MKSVRQQQPFLAAQPASVASRCIQGLANSILYGSKMTVKRGWKGFLRQIFNFSR